MCYYHYVCVADVPKGFNLEGPNVTVDGERVQFNCSVSAYYYSDSIIWKLNNYPIIKDSSKSHNISCNQMFLYCVYCWHNVNF